MGPDGAYLNYYNNGANVCPHAVNTGGFQGQDLRPLQHWGLSEGRTGRPIGIAVNGMFVASLFSIHYIDAIEKGNRCLTDTP